MYREIFMIFYQCYHTYIRTDRVHSIYTDCFIISGDILTHLPLDNMAAIFADDIFKCIFLNEKFCISIWISLKFVPKGLIDNKSALV